MLHHVPRSLSAHDRQTHWRRHVKNIVGRNIVGDVVAITDELMGVSQLFGGTSPGCPLPSLRLWTDGHTRAHTHTHAHRLTDGRSTDRRARALYLFTRIA